MISVWPHSVQDLSRNIQDSNADSDMETGAEDVFLMPSTGTTCVGKIWIVFFIALLLVGLAAGIYLLAEEREWPVSNTSVVRNIIWKAKKGSTPQMPAYLEDSIKNTSLISSRSLKRLLHNNFSTKKRIVQEKSITPPAKIKRKLILQFSNHTSDFLPASSPPEEIF